MSGSEINDPRRWSPDRIADWYAARPWPVGCNFYPSTAGNQLEMFQAATFDPRTIDRELGWAAGLGMNFMRVYLHDLMFHDDRDGLFERMDRYLQIADGHGIATMFVFLDDCWSDEGALGPQPEPIPGVHNSTWLRCPLQRGVERAFHDEAYRDTIRRYVQETIERFKDDRRVAAWDLYNEPTNVGKRTWRSADGGLRRWDPRPMGQRAIHAMVDHLFDWARQVDPAQPLTVGLWQGHWERDPLNQLQLQRSDLISFHGYGDAAGFPQTIEELRRLGGDRPLLCSEYLARDHGNTFQNLLPIFKQHRVGALNWGFVAGRSQTIYHWRTWEQPGPLPEPSVWHHDILRADGSAFDPEEVELIRQLTGVGGSSQ